MHSHDAQFSRVSFIAISKLSQVMICLPSYSKRCGRVVSLAVVSLAIDTPIAKWPWPQKRQTKTLANMLRRMTDGLRKQVYDGYAYCNQQYTDNGWYVWDLLEYYGTDNGYQYESNSRPHGIRNTYGNGSEH